VRVGTANKKLPDSYALKSVCFLSVVGAKRPVKLNAADEINWLANQVLEECLFPGSQRGFRNKGQAAGF
jgi:hypothetical protein